MIIMKKNIKMSTNRRIVALTCAFLLATSQSLAAFNFTLPEWFTNALPALPSAPAITSRLTTPLLSASHRFTSLIAATSAKIKKTYQDAPVKTTLIATGSAVVGLGSLFAFGAYIWKKIWPRSLSTQERECLEELKKDLKKIKEALPKAENNNNLIAPKSSAETLADAIIENIDKTLKNGNINTFINQYKDNAPTTEDGESKKIHDKLTKAINILTNKSQNSYSNNNIKIDLKENKNEKIEKIENKIDLNNTNDQNDEIKIENKNEIEENNKNEIDLTKTIEITIKNNNDNPNNNENIENQNKNNDDDVNNINTYPNYTDNNENEKIKNKIENKDNNEIEKIENNLENNDNLENKDNNIENNNLNNDNEKKNDNEIENNNNIEQNNNNNNLNISIFDLPAEKNAYFDMLKDFSTVMIKPNNNKIKMLEKEKIDEKLRNDLQECIKSGDYQCYDLIPDLINKGAYITDKIDDTMNAMLANCLIAHGGKINNAALLEQQPSMEDFIKSHLGDANPEKWEALLDILLWQNRTNVDACYEAMDEELKEALEIANGKEFLYLELYKRAQKHGLIWRQNEWYPSAEDLKNASFKARFDEGIELTFDDEDDNFDDIIDDVGQSVLEDKAKAIESTLQEIENDQDNPQKLASNLETLHTQNEDLKKTVWKIETIKTQASNLKQSILQSRLKNNNNLGPNTLMKSIFIDGNAKKNKKSAIENKQLIKAVEEREDDILTQIRKFQKNKLKKVEVNQYQKNDTVNPSPALQTGKNVLEVIEQFKIKKDDSFLDSSLLSSGWGNSAITNISSIHNQTEIPKQNTIEKNETSEKNNIKDDALNNETNINQQNNTVQKVANKIDALKKFFEKKVENIVAPSTLLKKNLDNTIAKTTQKNNNFGQMNMKIPDKIKQNGVGYVWKYYFEQKKKLNGYDSDSENDDDSDDDYDSDSNEKKNLKKNNKLNLRKEQPRNLLNNANFQAIAKYSGGRNNL